jgi:hypothetical protein
MIPGRRVAWLGFWLVVLGIFCLIVSDKDVHGWWQGTLQAFGVGFIVGGMVDVIAISSLDRILKADQREREQFNSSAREGARELMEIVSSLSEFAPVESSTAGGRAAEIEVWLDRKKWITRYLKDHGQQPNTETVATFQQVQTQLDKRLAQLRDRNPGDPAV